ncbi:Uncharacterised protein [Citrobacter koseri]|nr:Uncharacterised protein [Citrobacter koseri]STB72171.1 Uncharacterised protein [Citrobacter koseri]STT22339.1 Uncharacterised protein [Citrobacter koseri]VFS10597.1 Uncharacterised protein [Citrobacter koseri]
MTEFMYKASYIIFTIQMMQKRGYEFLYKTNAC